MANDGSPTRKTIDITAKIVVTKRVQVSPGQKPNGYLVDTQSTYVEDVDLLDITVTKGDIERLSAALTGHLALLDEDDA